MARANDAFAAEQYGAAEKDYREVLRISSDDPVALRQLGVIYQEQGQAPQAYPLLKRVAELQPDDTTVQIKLALTLLAIGDFAQAREGFLQARGACGGDDGPSELYLARIERLAHEPPGPEWDGVLTFETK